MRHHACRAESPWVYSLFVRADGRTIATTSRTHTIRRERGSPMRPHKPNVRLWFPVLFVLAAPAAHGQSAQPGLDARARAALREAAASPSLPPWQHDFMLRLSG